MVITGDVMTASNGVSPGTRYAMRRAMSCSVTIPTGRPAASTTMAQDAFSAANSAIMSAQRVPVRTASTSERDLMESRTNKLNTAVRDRPTSFLVLLPIQISMKKRPASATHRQRTHSFTSYHQNQRGRSPTDQTTFADGLQAPAPNSASTNPDRQNTDSEFSSTEFANQQ